jgi:hypothetical protein
LLVEPRRGDVARGDLPVHDEADPLELVQLAIALGPDADCLVHVGDVAEPPEQRDDLPVIGGGVLAFEQALPDGSEIRVRLLQLEARPLITQGHPKVHLECAVVVLVAGDGVARQMVDRVPVACRPASLAGDVRPEAGESAHRPIAERQETAHEDEVHRDDEDELVDQGEVDECSSDSEVPDTVPDRHIFSQ